jgi:hypothetical protein
MINVKHGGNPLRVVTGLKGLQGNFRAIFLRQFSDAELFNRKNIFISAE